MHTVEALIKMTGQTQSCKIKFIMETETGRDCGREFCCCGVFEKKVAACKSWHVASHKRETLSALTRFPHENSNYMVR